MKGILGGNPAPRMLRWIGEIEDIWIGYDFVAHLQQTLVVSEITRIQNFILCFNSFLFLSFL